MLPVPHQACTLATGALRSVCTMIVRPLGKVHFCAVTGGNVIGGRTARGSGLESVGSQHGVNANRWRRPYRS